MLFFSRANGTHEMYGIPTTYLVYLGLSLEEMTKQITLYQICCIAVEGTPADDAKYREMRRERRNSEESISEELQGIGIYIYIYKA